jgi:hypothetical protein
MIEAAMQNRRTPYDEDYYAWTQQQVDLMKAGRLSELDTEHLIDEINDMGRSQKRELVNRLIELIAHLLKWQYQPARRSTSWRITIIGQRRDIAKHLWENPSLTPYVNEAVEDAYLYAVVQAAEETGQDASVFPETCPFHVDQITNKDFWPD